MPPAFRIAAWIDQDLSALGRAGGLHRAHEVDDVVQQLEELLRADPPRSPVLVGLPGTGKTTVIHGLLRRVADGAGPPVLRGRRVVQLSISNIVAQFKEKEQAADLARQLFAALAAEGTVAYIRDLHVAYNADWEPLLYRFLVQSGLPLLGEGQATGVSQVLESATDLAQHIVVVPVDEPRGDRLQRIVRAWSADSERGTGRIIEESAQDLAVELTGRFLGDRPYPRKVLDLLAQARDLASPGPAGTVHIRQRDVVDRFSATTRVPARLVDPEVPLDLDEMRAFLAARLLGQEEAADAALRMVALIKAGLTDPTRPFGVFLFVGPTGVGKTHTAQLLAQYLFGDRNRMVRINLTDFAGDGGLERLFGNPEAYGMDARMGVLSRRLRGHPFGVLLLDEFEKCSSKVHNAFMQLLDEGRFTNGLGETVSVTSLIVIATSNAGAEVFREAGLGFRGEPDLAALDAELDRRLHRTFLFELVNRFDRVVHFHPLARVHIRAIAERELAELLRRQGIVSRGLVVEVDPEVVEWLAAHGYHPHYGARFLRREIERHVTSALADVVVRARPRPGARILVSVRGDRVTVRVLAEPAAPRARVRVPDGDGARTVHLAEDALRAEAAAWVTRWAPLLAEAEARRGAASALVERSAAPDFWSDPSAADEVLRAWSRLEARVQADDRLTAPVRALAEVLAGTRPVAIAELAGAVEDATWNYRRWIDLGAADGPDAAWLWLTPGDPLAPAPGWLAEMVAMYTAWFEHKGFPAAVVAEEESGGEVVSAVFVVEGPGVLRVLEMEHGRHRRRRPDGTIDRVRVELIPRRDAPAEASAVVSDARHGKGAWLPRRTTRLTVSAAARGRKIQLLGADRAVLLALGGDLAAALAAPAPELEIARSYGVDGVVRDPRTDVVVASVRDVLRGDLEPFLRAWESR